LYASSSEPMMPAIERVTLEDLRRPGATLGAGVSAGFVAGVLIGGVGGRLAMLALRLTSDPSLHGVLTDDGFTIGRVSLETLFLLGVTAGLEVLQPLVAIILGGLVTSTLLTLVVLPVLYLMFAVRRQPAPAGGSDQAREHDDAIR